MSKDKKSSNPNSGKSGGTSGKNSWIGESKSDIDKIQKAAEVKPRTTGGGKDKK